MGTGRLEHHWRRCPGCGGYQWCRCLLGVTHQSGYYLHEECYKHFARWGATAFERSRHRNAYMGTRARMRRRELVRAYARARSAPPVDTSKYAF